MDPVTGSFTIPPLQFSQNWFLWVTVKKKKKKKKKTRSHSQFLHWWGLWDAHALVTMISASLTLVKKENEKRGCKTRNNYIHMYVLSLCHPLWLLLLMAWVIVSSNNLAVILIIVTMATKKQWLKLWCFRGAIHRIRVKPWDYNTDCCLHGNYWHT